MLLPTVDTYGSYVTQSCFLVSGLEPENRFWILCGILALVEEAAEGLHSLIQQVCREVFAPATENQCKLHQISMPI